jgi:hypothetical protein
VNDLTPASRMILQERHEDGTWSMSANRMESMLLAAQRQAVEAVTRATLAATPAPLDVERLARAMHRTENPDGGECSDLMGKHGRWARNLAAAYAEEADRD